MRGIKKSLECCSKGKCIECPYVAKNLTTCHYELMADALALIEQQEEQLRKVDMKEALCNLILCRDTQLVNLKETLEEALIKNMREKVEE